MPLWYSEVIEKNVYQPVTGSERAGKEKPDEKGNMVFYEV